MRKYVLLLLSLLIGFASCTSEGKQLRKNIRQGNKDYRSGAFVDAEIDYRKALDEDIRSTDAAYNLGNALYRQGKGEDAFKQYKLSADNSDDKADKAKAYHNIGNLAMNAQDIQNAVQSYREALRNNPADDETRHNLAIAQMLMQNQENQDEQQQEQEQEQQEEQEQEQQQEQQQQQQQPEEQEQQQEQQQHDSSQMSPDQAQQILDALMQDEKDTQEKVQLQEQQQMDKRKIDKNW